MKEKQQHDYKRDLERIHINLRSILEEAEELYEAFGVGAVFAEDVQCLKNEIRELQAVLQSLIDI